MKPSKSTAHKQTETFADCITQGVQKPIDVVCAMFNGVRRRVVRTHRDAWADFVSLRLPELLVSDVAPADDSDEAFDAAKLTLPAFILAPVDSVRKDGMVGDHTALVIDVDSLSASRKAFLRTCARYTCAVYESPSSGVRGKGDRLRVIAALAEPIPVALVKAARRAFARDLGLDPAASGVTKADAVSQIMFVGRVDSTPERKLWAFEGKVWAPPAVLEPDAAQGKAGAATSPSEADRDEDELPEVPAELVKAIEPNPRGQRHGGRDLMRGLGGYWARKGYRPVAVYAAAYELPSSQPEKRATEAREAAEQWYSGDERTAGANEIARHFTDALGESVGRVTLAALDESYKPPRWAVRWGEAALAKIKAGAEVTPWRVNLIEWAGLELPRGAAARAASALARTGRSAAAMAERRAENAAALAEVAPGLDGLETDDNGAPLGTPDNVIKCVRHYLGHALAFDATTSTAVLLEPVRMATGPGETLEAGPWQDDYLIRVQAALNRLQMRHVYSGDTHNAVRSVARERPIDVLGDWLRGLAEAWDGRARVDSALHTYWRAVDEPLSSAVSRVMLLSIAARGLCPGCQLDTVPVLISQQGSFKSQGFKALVWGKHRANPAALGYGVERRYCGSEIDIGNKDAMAVIRGRLIWEFAELSSARKADLNKLKAYLTQQSDTFRPSHGKAEVTYLRTVAFVGSVNPEKSGYVIVNRDTTGGRRWLPVHVAVGYLEGEPDTFRHRVDVEAIERDHEQLLGEAARRVLDREQWHPTDAEVALIAPATAAVSEDPLRDDPWYTPIRAWVRRQAKASKAFTIADVFHHALDMVDVAKHGRAEALRIAGVLRDLGCVEKRSKRARLWISTGD